MSFEAVGVISVFVDLIYATSIGPIDVLFAGICLAMVFGVSRLRKNWVRLLMIVLLIASVCFSMFGYVEHFELFADSPILEHLLFALVVILYLVQLALLFTREVENWVLEPRQIAKARD